eukprot:SAG31_NODE_6749_length_1900_cov_3.448640_2_plen_227_part_00
MYKVTATTNTIYPDKSIAVDTARQTAPSELQRIPHTQKKMRTTASLSLLSLWTEMAAVCLGEASLDHGRDTAHPTTTCTGELIEAVTSGLGRCAALHEETDTSARPGDPAVRGGFKPVFGSRPECDKFYGTAVSCGAVSPFPQHVADDSLEQHELLCGPNWSNGELDWSHMGHDEEMFSVCAGSKNTGQQPTAENIPRVPSIDIIRCAAAAYPAAPPPVYALIAER